jgi:hypothetical protein
MTKVSFGPNDSFIAWDSKSIRWDALPARLEELVQSWLSPAGWLHGPPRNISLGQGGAYFAITEHNWWAYYGLPGDMANELSNSQRDLGTTKVRVSISVVHWAPFDICSDRLLHFLFTAHSTLLFLTGITIAMRSTTGISRKAARKQFAAASTHSLLTRSQLPAKVLG